MCVRIDSQFLNTQMVEELKSRGCNTEECYADGKYIYAFHPDNYYVRVLFEI